MTALNLHWSISEQIQNKNQQKNKTYFLHGHHVNTKVSQVLW